MRADSLTPANPSELYERDFYSWTLQQSAALRRVASERINTSVPLDWAHLAEEIESMGKEQAAKLRSSYRILLLYLLKWAYQPDHGSKSWENTIGRERDNIELHLSDNPGLRPRCPELFDQAYRLARREAARETGLPLATFPTACPFPLADAIREDWWPETASSHP